MNLSDAERMAHDLMIEHIPWLGYRFAWMDSKTINGYCSYSKKEIRLSRFLTARRSIEAVRVTVIHEIAHALTPGAHHGKRWRAQMRALGIHNPQTRSPDRVDISDAYRWKGVCPRCGYVLRMIRKPRVTRSCGGCSRSFNPDYQLQWSRIQS